MRKFFIAIKLICQGWKNFILDFISDVKYRKYFHERYLICDDCEHNKNGICGKCGCIINIKTMAEDAECPVGKWQTIEETIAKLKK